jgi:hypothetical protein
LNCPYTSSDLNQHGTDWRLGLTDGSWETDARHCFASNESSTFPKYATVDLGAVSTVGRIVFGVPPFGSTKDVKVEISVDGKTFTEVGGATFSLGKAERVSIDVPKASARYVRLAYTANYKEEKGYNANFVFTSEVEVYPPAK